MVLFFNRPFIIYLTISLESIMFIFEILRNGITVANKQALAAQNVAPRIGRTEIETN